MASKYDLQRDNSYLETLKGDLNSVANNLNQSAEYVNKIHVIENVINAISTFIDNNPSHITAYISDNARYENAPVPKEKKAGNNKNTIVNNAAII